MDKNQHPFPCKRCDQFPREAFKISPATEGWLKIFPELNLIHVHFGRATVSEAESNSESLWVYEIIVNNWYNEHPNTKFFIAADFYMESDAEFPSETSKETYQKILQHPQTDAVICYRTTQGMRMFITVLIHIARTVKKLKIVKTEEEMEEEFSKWRVAKGLGN